MLLPEKPAKTASETGPKCQHQEDAAPKFRNRFPEEYSQADAKDKEHLVAPARHDPADLDGPVVVFEKCCNTVGVDLDT